jgi:hypothetical protein
MASLRVAGLEQRLLIERWNLMPREPKRQFVETATEGQAEPGPSILLLLMISTLLILSVVWFLFFRMVPLF